VELLVSAERLPPDPPAVDYAEWHFPARVGFEHLVQQGPVLVAASSMFPGVAPDFVRVQGPSVVLRFGFGLVPAISDLSWDDTSLVGTLAFAGQPFTCRVPWCAVLAVKLEGRASVPVHPSRATHLKLVE
jgi:hypothetical protein